MEFVLATTERKRLLVPVPFMIAKLKALFLQYLPKPLLTPDQVELLKHDNVVSEEAAREDRTLEGLGIDPIAAATVVAAAHIGDLSSGECLRWHMPTTRLGESEK
jgi:hypothetical protein